MELFKTPFLPSFLSCVFVSLSQFSLVLIIPYFFNSSLLSVLAMSAVLLVAVGALGKFCRRALRIPASAPASVFFNLVFIWGVYVAVIREGNPSLQDFVFNAECVMLIIGLYSILSGDPGLVAVGNSCLDRWDQSAFSVVNSHSKEEESSVNIVCHEESAAKIENGHSLQRIRYCNICKAFIKGFDHHCPAFGNCIGQKNHLHFMVLLVGFIVTEASYVAFSSPVIRKSGNTQYVDLEDSLSGNLAISTMLFSLLQVLWQVVFLIWHMYCICFNIKTDEWINWKKYPEFHLIVQPQPGQPIPEVLFRNPYHKGIMGNLKEFLKVNRPFK